MGQTLNFSSGNQTPVNLASGKRKMKTLTTKALFSWGKNLALATVALSFVFSNISDHGLTSSKDSSRKLHTV